MSVYDEYILQLLWAFIVNEAAAWYYESFPMNVHLFIQYQYMYPKSKISP